MKHPRPMFSRALTRAASAMARRLCKYRGKPFAEAIARSIDAFHRRLNNVDFDMAHNGELRVLQIVSQFQPKVVFDVGANKGEWCRLVSTLCPSCMIHAFEIVPATYEELTRNTRDLQNVIANNIGLSSEEGAVSISLGRDTATATACKIEGMQFHEEYYDRQIQCKTRKASDYLIEKAIESIDFVKIDVEGMDLKVVRGLGDQIRNVRVVQFEYGVFNIASHDLLSDFCRHFKNHGFIVGKIFPRSVNFFEYHWDMENFHGSNYLAVRNEETELIRRLARFGA
jgi:FkbM family methyltransferase